MKKFILVLIISAIGCAAKGDLSATRAALERAQNCPEVKQYAASRLVEAQAAYNKAQNSFDTDDIYVAKRKSEMAIAEGMAKKNEEELALLQKEYDSKLASDRKKKEDEQALEKAKEEELSRAQVDLSEAVKGAGEVKKDDRGLVIYISDILFDTGKTELKQGTVDALTRISQALVKYPKYKIAVEGHTDSVGSDAYNLKLSESRASAVGEFLIGHGIGAERVNTKGYGESRPVATNDTADGRQRNRRVEVVVSE
jgi:outer membrane protein OmpA-like peptidoglycan-associated protein